MLILLLCGGINSFAFSLAPEVYDLVVAQDGSGDFLTINEAIEAATDDGIRNTIFIKKGTYQEKVFIGNRWQTSEKVISLIGEHVDSVTVIWDDYNGKIIPYPGREGTITADGTTCPTMTVTSPDFYMENITVINPSTEAQAVALYQAGDRQVLKNCKILGHQDTHRTRKGRRFFYFQCTIEGGVDFIYAGGTCYFYQCNIVSNRGGFITAPEDVPYSAKLASGKDLRYGFFFRDCDITATDGVSAGSVYLGRPWQPECGAVFLECRLGDHINAAGWTTFGAGNEQTACFAEYSSFTADGSALADVSQRIAWSAQVTTEDLNKLMLLSRIYRAVSSQKFEPIPTVVAPSAPTELSVEEQYLEWSPVADAVGYVVYANGTAIGFNDAENYQDTLTYTSPPTYSVYSVGPHGNLSAPNGHNAAYSVEGLILAIDTPLDLTGLREAAQIEQYIPRMVNGRILFDQPVDCQIFSVLGRKVIQEKATLDFELDQLASGVYIFLITMDGRKFYSFKVSHVQP